MRKSGDSPVVKELVLIGGGHSHVAVLKRFGMKPMPGLRITLITRDVHTPYSGMLPGYVAGHYGYDDSHIDLRPLAQFAGARLYHTEVEGMDLAEGRIHCKNRPPVYFDSLSINTGSRPDTISVPGAERFALPVKPIDRFLLGWADIVERARAAGDKFRIVVVGAGAGGVELTLSVQYRLEKILAATNSAPGKLDCTIISSSEEILPTHNDRMRKTFQRVLEERGIRVHAANSADRVTEHGVHLQDGSFVAADAVLWVTSASAPDWLRESGLDVDELGFVKVDDSLRSLSHQNVFAAGDVACVVNHPRPKSGVFAVRQGPPLVANLRRHLAGKNLKPFKPQEYFLSLVSTGDQYAVASRGNFSFEGKWVWKLKDWIDRRFMEKFSDLPEMKEEADLKLAHGLADQDVIKEISAIAMRCGGCGAKVGSSVLSRVVNKLQPTERDDVLIGLNAPDDAAVVEVPPGQVLAQSVDYFRAFIDDPYIFGRIAANHSLGDIFAMGATAQSAMAIATVPFGQESDVEEQLYQMMTGAVEVLNDCGCALVGGHSSEGAELSFGLSVTGLCERNRIMTKSGLKPGEVLILTKPIGTGTLFAADMRKKARGRWVHAALDSMLVSNHQAAQCLHRYGVSACTDVTGFGLLGHLVEMTRAVNVNVVLYPDAVPLLDGAMQTVEAGIFSSLQPENIRLRRAIRDIENAAQHKRYPLLFDPQTAGGLLASVPVNHAEACIEELWKLGYKSSAIIGQVLPPDEQIEAVIIEGGEPAIIGLSQQTAGFG